MLLVDSKKREEAIFDIFKDKYSLNGEFIHDDSPDFIGLHDGTVLGIEITEIYREETLREHEIQKERIVDRACKKAIQIGLSPLHVAVLYSGNIQKGRESYLTEILFELVKNNCPEDGGHLTLDWENDIPDDFHAILIYNIPGSKKHIWSTTEVGFIETNFSEQLQRRINSKSKKIKNYLAKCKKSWLIIVSLGVSASNFYEIGEEMEQVYYKSPFEKVFFMESFSRTIRELKVNYIPIDVSRALENTT